MVDPHTCPLDDAVAWASGALGRPVAVRGRLTGGLTSTMLLLETDDGAECVLRLMTDEPWRAHGAALTAREQRALAVLSTTTVPAPESLALDADGVATGGIAAHLMTRVPGRPTVDAPDAVGLRAMADLLARIHDVVPAEPFRTFESWAWEAKRQVPPWTDRPATWRRAFDLLAAGDPTYEPTLLHRDASHRNLLWDGPVISGVVDWVETSTGPAWLDVAHAASTLAVLEGPEPAAALLGAYAAHTGGAVEPFWLVMDAVGHLPAPGRQPLFGAPDQLARLDAWLDHVVGLAGRSA